MPRVLYSWCVVGATNATVVWRFLKSEKIDRFLVCYHQVLIAIGLLLLRHCRVTFWQLLQKNKTDCFSSWNTPASVQKKKKKNQIYMKQKAMYTCRHREEQSKEQNGSIWSNVNCCSQVHVRNSPSENSFKSPCKRKNCVKTSISSYKSGRCQMILRNLEERSWYKIQVIIRTKTFVLERAKRQCNLKIKV